MPKKKRKHQCIHTATITDVDRHLMWLFQACKLQQNNEGTNEFLLYLKRTCDETVEQMEEEYKTGKHGRIINVLPFMSARLADLCNVHHDN